MPTPFSIQSFPIDIESHHHHHLSLSLFLCLSLGFLMAVVAIGVNSPAFSPSTFPKTPSFCSPLSIAPPLPLPPLLPVPLRIEPAAEEKESSVLSRKRPARLSIPRTMGSAGFGEVGVREVGAELVEVREDTYGVYSKRGRRGGRLEDRFSAVVGIQGDSKQAFFGVFDGHGGAKAAEFAAKNMDKNILQHMAGNSDSNMEEAVRDAYLKTDADFMLENANGGTCCVSAWIWKGELVVSNAGDCRAVISRGGTAEALTTDHRPSLESERERIEALGAYVDCCRGIWRIQGSLAVSRSIGDQHLKHWVIPVPETKTLQVSPDCEFLVLASDGLWDKVTNQEAVDLVRAMNVDANLQDPFSACKKLAELSMRRGSTDDITVLVIDLRRFVS
ncbi:probable protein phosphatase 2C 30 [Rhodamnia argentea]|uniref:protein-serine/threonine phosphatase n=1 Tax=Rhodamnia argentea TaxID=178133 RepID=A0A8B8PIK1_9MYRT|nr:probable protein phosphatase 2C 30 [Rhodamnia argentea]